MELKGTGIEGAGGGVNRMRICIDLLQCSDAAHRSQDLTRRECRAGSNNWSRFRSVRDRFDATKTGIDSARTRLVQGTKEFSC
jgi:hypothetical protein